MSSKRREKQFRGFRPSNECLIYKGVGLVDVVYCLHCHDLFEEDDFGGGLIFSSFLVGEEQVLSENQPSSDWVSSTVARF